VADGQAGQQIRALSLDAGSQFHQTLQLLLAAQRRKHRQDGPTRSGPVQERDQFLTGEESPRGDPGTPDADPH
jgi:hypothetical protein